MVVLKSNISWTTGTLNPWVGCKAVSEGCRFCYAKALVDGPRGAHFGQRFEQVKLHLGRLDQIRQFKPILAGDGRRAPSLVFVNSMSDFFLEDVPDEAVHQALDAFEGAPDTVFQILSKRPVRARKIIVDRYGNSGVPDNLWFGFSVEDNRVKGRIDIMRKIKDRVGGRITAFLSVEPIVGPTDEMDMTGMDWVITGGESGGHARVMQREWLLPAIEAGIKAGAASWYKQAGQPRSHPNLAETDPRLGIQARFKWLVANGWEMLPDEKGGATVDKRTYRQFPAAFDRISERLNTTLV